MGDRQVVSPPGIIIQLADSRVNVTCINTYDFVVRCGSIDIIVPQPHLVIGWNWAYHSPLFEFRLHEISIRSVQDCVSLSSVMKVTAALYAILVDDIEARGRLLSSMGYRESVLKRLADSVC